MALFLRVGGFAAAFMGLMTAGSLIFAEDTNAPPAPAPAVPPVVPDVNRPFLSTNSATSTFLENHPELAQPAPPGQTNQPDLSFQSGTTPPAEQPPQARPPDAETTPEAFHFLNGTSQPEDMAAHLLVVYNQNDPDSKGLAEYYASQRSIPEERVLAIACPTTEEITRAEYEETIREPIISYICQKNWMKRHSMNIRIGGNVKDLLVATTNDIWAMVLMRGVPLKIAEDPTDDSGMEDAPELATNAAAVDSELALLPIFGLPKGGYVPNVFFDDKASGASRVGPDLAKNIVLVTRLDGPKPEDVRRMIDDSIYAEQNRLAGLAVVDSRGLTDVSNGYTSGDVWLREARRFLINDGFLVKFDENPDVLPPTDPSNHVAVYLGWYRDGAYGPWVTPPDRFVRGAIAYHLHSFSATTVRSATAAWVGPLIAHGAAATMGTVYEPYLAMTPHEDIFIKRLLDGNYFCEAAYASQRGLSWMTTVVGDPLYRPFKDPLESVLFNLADNHTDHDDWLLLQKIEREIEFGASDGRVDILKQFLDRADTGPVICEGLGDLAAQINDPQVAPLIEQAYEKALNGDTIPIDRIRVGLKLAQYYGNHGQDARAQAEMDVLRELYPADAKRFGVADPLVPTSATPPPVVRRNASPTLPELPKPPGPPQPQ